MKKEICALASGSIRQAYMVFTPELLVLNTAFQNTVTRPVVGSHNRLGERALSPECFEIALLTNYLRRHRPRGRNKLTGNILSRCSLGLAVLYGPTATP